MLHTQKSWDTATRRYFLISTNGCMIWVNYKGKVCPELFHHPRPPWTCNDKHIFPSLFQLPSTLVSFPVFECFIQTKSTLSLSLSLFLFSVCVFFIFFLSHYLYLLFLDCFMCAYLFIYLSVCLSLCLLVSLPKK